MEINKTDMLIATVLLLGGFFVGYALHQMSDPYVEASSQAVLATSGAATTAGSTYTGRVMMVHGGSLNDTMNIFASYSKSPDAIIGLDCSNGTGENCILLFNK